MTDKKDKCTIYDVMGCAFIALFDRYSVEGFHKCKTKEEAIRSLEYGSEEGLIMDIAVIDSKTHKMVWYKDYLGEKVCERRVLEFIKKHCP